MSSSAKNADLDKYVYSGYLTEFNLYSVFSLLDGRVDKSDIIFGTDMLIIRKNIY